MKRTRISSEEVRSYFGGEEIDVYYCEDIVSRSQAREHILNIISSGIDREEWATVLAKSLFIRIYS